MEFDKIVKKLRKKGQKLLTIREISDDFAKGKMQNAKDKMDYKLIHRLISTGVIVSIRKGMYLLHTSEKPSPEDFYWSIVKKVLAENYMGQGIITGSKALGFDLRDYSLPEALQVIVPKDKARIAILADHILIAHPIQKDSKSSLYPLIKEYSSRATIEGIEFLVSCPEHALLEALTTRTGTDITDTGLIERWLRKNASRLREAIFAEFIPYRYISATNRLKYLAYDLGMTELYQMMIRLIEREGKGCHLSRDYLMGKKKVTSIKTGYSY